jgi:hypothetical protein
MAIRTVVTRGYGNGTFSGTIALVTTRGYSIGEALTLAIYTMDVLSNPSPLLRGIANISPARDVDSNPSPAREAGSG